MNEAVRFIVITTPPPEVGRPIDEARQLVSGISGSRAALAYPPHVTLRTGMLVPSTLVSSFLDAFEVVVAGWEPFPIETDGLWITSYRDRERKSSSSAIACRRTRSLRDEPPAPDIHDLAREQPV